MQLRFREGNIKSQFTLYLRSFLVISSGGPWLD